MEDRGTLEVRNAIVEAAFPVLHQAGCEQPDKESELQKNVVENHQAGSVEDDDGSITIGDLKVPHATTNCNTSGHLVVLS